MRQYDENDLRNWKGSDIYDEMQTDAQVKACLIAKKYGILCRKWEIHPAVDSTAANFQEALDIANFVRWCLADMRGSIHDLLFTVLDAVAKGYSIHEINWKLIDGGEYAGKIGIESIKSKQPANYRFELDEYMNIKSLVLRAPGSSVDKKLDPAKFIIYTYMPKYSEPWGQPDLRAAYKHWWSKHLIIKFWNLYLEKFGMPTAKGTYPRGWNQDRQDELLAVLDLIQQETAVIVPEGVEVELLEAMRRGDSSYNVATDWHDSQIAKAICGQTLTSGEGNSSGSYALAKVHEGVFKYYLIKLARDMEEAVMVEQVIRRLVNLNFDSTLYPKFSLGDLEDRDVMSLGVFITQLIDKGVIGTDEPWIRDYIGLPPRTSTEPIVTPAQQVAEQIAQNQPSGGNNDANQAKQQQRKSKVQANRASAD